MLELDLVLQSFLDRNYDEATRDEQHAFETLLNYPDPLLLEYVMGRMTPTDPLLPPSYCPIGLSADHLDY